MKKIEEKNWETKKEHYVSYRLGGMVLDCYWIPYCNPVGYCDMEIISLLEGRTRRWARIIITAIIIITIIK